MRNAVHLEKIGDSLLRNTFHICLFTLFLLGLSTFFGKFDFREIYTSIKKSNLNWLAAAFFAGVSGHMAKAVRWRNQVRTMKYDLSFNLAFSSIISGLAFDFMAPKVGEFARCNEIKRANPQIPVASLAGAVALDRIFDGLIAASIIILAISIGAAPIINSLAESSFDGWSIAKVSIVVSALILSVFIISNSQLKPWLKKQVTGMIAGLRSIKTMRDLRYFFAWSILAWFCYFIQTRFGIKAFFSDWQDQNTVSLTLFAAGLFGMMAPVQGGIGFYHALVASSLIHLGANNDQALAFAIALHCIYALTTVGLYFALKTMVMSTKWIKITRDKRAPDFSLVGTPATLSTFSIRSLRKSRLGSTEMIAAETISAEVNTAIICDSQSQEAIS